MNLSAVYLKGKQMLSDFGIESCAFEALALMEPCFGINRREQLSIMGNVIAERDKCQRYFELINERKDRPLQYILGKWSFMDMELEVGEGVLVPREDTEVLVEAGADFIGDKNMRVLDLCSGSGAVALGIVSKCKNARVTAAELSEEAAFYLRKNVLKYGGGRCEILMGDITKPEIYEKIETADVILSNPPYIPAGVIETLSLDVKKEPRMALDGGGDGLYFYRIILKEYKRCLNPGGLLAVEVGWDQSQTVAKMFKQSGFCNVEIKNDLAGIGRVVLGFNPC